MAEWKSHWAQYQNVRGLIAISNHVWQCWVTFSFHVASITITNSAMMDAPMEWKCVSELLKLLHTCMMCVMYSLWRNDHGFVQPHCAKKPVTTMLTYPWKYTVLHCNHLGNTWKPLSASEGDNQSVGSSAPVFSRCFPGGYNVKLYISRGTLAWWLLAFLCCVVQWLAEWTCHW